MAKKDAAARSTGLTRAGRDMEARKQSLIKSKLATGSSAAAGRDSEAFKQTIIKNRLANRDPQHGSRSSGKSAKTRS